MNKGVEICDEERIMNEKMKVLDIKEEYENKIFLNLSAPKNNIGITLKGVGPFFDEETIKFLLIFGNYDNNHDTVSISLNNEFIVTENIKNTIKEYIKFITDRDLYNKTTIKLDRFFNEIPEGTVITILMGDEPFTELECFESYVKSCLLNGVNISNYFVNGKRKFLKKYIKISPLEKYKIGEAEKEKRKCRFCGRTISEGATYKSKAHAISEAIGNKKYILHDECDTCNNYFSNTIENDLLEMFTIERLALKIKGKKNRIPIKKVGKLRFDANDTDINMFNIYSGDEKIENGNVIYGNFIPQNVYKALVKFGLSTIENYEKYEKLIKTAEWIRTRTYQNKLPEILIIYTKNAHETANFVYKQVDKDVFIGHLIFSKINIIYNIPIFPLVDEISLIDFCTKYLKTEFTEISKLCRQNLSENRTVYGVLPLKFKNG